MNQDYSLNENNLNHQDKDLLNTVIIKNKDKENNKEKENDVKGDSKKNDKSKGQDHKTKKNLNVNDIKKKQKH